MEANEIGLDDIIDIYPLTMLQAGMIYHSECNPESSMYHDIFSYFLKGDYDFKILQDAVERVVSNHPVLRTSFNLSDFSEPLQIVHHSINVPIEEEDVRQLTVDEQKKQIAQWVEEEKKRLFNWKKPPLFRIKIFRSAEDSFLLILSFHHSILDGWSVASMMTELYQTYLFLSGKTDNGVEPPKGVSFRDYVALEREALISEDCKNYWLNKLANSSFTQIPRWPSEKGKGRHGIKYVPISADISKGVNKLAKAIGVPIKDVLLAAHLRVMSLISGEDKVVTGLVSNGRLEENDGERVLGLFLNTLPFYLEIKGGTWIELIRETFKNEQELIPFRRYPLMRILKDLNKPSLFETVFNYTNFHIYKEANLGANDMESLGIHGFEQTNFLFASNFSYSTDKQQIYLQLNYDSEEFCEEQMEAIAQYFINTLSRIAENPAGDYGSNNILSEMEKNKLLKLCRGEKTEDEQCMCFQDIIETYGKNKPDDIAILYKEQQITYKQLNDKANRLARYLRKLGVGSETFVGVCMERSPELILSMLAIWKAGGAYVPLDLAYPKERISFIINDTSLSLIITKDNSIEQLLEHNVRVISLEKDWKKVSKEKSENIVRDTTIDNLAYIIYTSGSTGKPKGVLLNHRGLVNVIERQKKTFNIKYGDRILQLASIGFDASIAEIVMALGPGATLCIADTEEILPGKGLIKLLKDLKITVMTMTPSALSYLPSDELRDLRIINVAGEACSKELVDEWSEGRKFLNLYGPTEATIWTTVYECKKNSGKPLIGKAIDNIEVYILDTKQELIPIGVPGELCISGVGLARGYLNRDDLNIKKFIPNPYGGKGSERLYRTGDLARYLSDGNIEFLGRIDNQVKIRGFRIELGEIESLLVQNGAIKEAVVIVREDKPGEKRLVSYLVMNEGMEFELIKVRQYLLNKVPDYMVPAAFVVIDKLPLTPNGKIDLGALPVPDGARPDLERVFIAPRTQTERKLAEIWMEILILEQVGIHDNFFELGGHSLLALQLVNRIRDEFKIELPLSHLFRAATVEKLAIEIVQAQSLVEENAEMAALLAEIEQISDEEVEELVKLRD
jgi:amino acid adenylation domain-containing protein